MTQVNMPSGIAAVTFFRLLPRGALDADASGPCPLPAVLRDRHLLVPFRYLPGQAFRVGHHFGGRALRDDVAAVHAGAGANVDHIIREADRVLVMLDHDHRVAEIAQLHERLEQAFVVALVQADGRLVEHVEHAGEAGADLRGEADALAFAAGQRAGGADEVRVVEADIDEEVQPVVDLLQDAGGDFLLLCRQLG